MSESDKVTIIIADDHDIIREGIKSILAKQPDFQVLAEAGDGEQAVELCQEHQPQILLLDISMPKRSGLDVLEQVHHISPHTKIIIVSMHRASIYLNTAFRACVQGYLNKENVVEDLVPALRKVLRGQMYICSSLSPQLVGQLTNKQAPEDNPDSLSGRELDVLRLVVGGKTAKEIADTLFISHRTVENYKNNLLKKLNLNKTSDLIKYALIHGIVETE